MSDKRFFGSPRSLWEVFLLLILNWGVTGGVSGSPDGPFPCPNPFGALLLASSSEAGTVLAVLTEPGLFPCRALTCVDYVEPCVLAGMYVKTVKTFLLALYSDINNQTIGPTALVL